MNGAAEKGCGRNVQEPCDIYWDGSCTAGWNINQLTSVSNSASRHCSFEGSKRDRLMAGKQRARSLSGADQRGVKAGKRQSLTHSQVEISRVVNCKSVPVGESENIVIGDRISQAYWQFPQRFQKAVGVCFSDALAPDSHQNGVAIS